MSSLLKSSSRELVDFHFKCLQGMYFSEYVPGNNYVLLFSDLIEDAYYNYLAHIDGKLEGILEETTPAFIERGRKPAFYFTPLSSEYKAGAEEAPQGFTKWATDAWMTLGDSTVLANYRTPEGITVERVDESNREEYVKAFAQAYSSDNPDDPYGQLPASYTESLRRSFNYQPKEYKKVYLMARMNDIPVSVVTMFYDDSIAGVYGLGTIHGYRERGVGKSLMAELLREASANGVKQMMLQTEFGSYVEGWYQRMGFKTEFVGTYYVHD